ncbi:hypothetical protein ACJMK2_015943, partial [Sinanodonta woodiana]
YLNPNQIKTFGTLSPSEICCHSTIVTKRNSGTQHSIIRRGKQCFSPALGLHTHPHPPPIVAVASCDDSNVTESQRRYCDVFMMQAPELCIS